MKVLMIHVGNRIEGPTEEDDPRFLRRRGLLEGRDMLFLKSDIGNADSQMRSIVDRGIEVEDAHMTARRSPTALLKAGRRIREISSRPEIDLTHVMWGGTAGLVTVLFSKKPVVISFCGSDLLGKVGPRGTPTAGGRVSRLLSLASALFARALITKSSGLKATLRLGTGRKAFVIPNGVDLSLFHPMPRREARAALGIDHERPLVLFFYNEGAWVKNPELARSAFRAVQGRVAEAELLTAAGIAPERLVLYYNACDVMILTSYHEGSNNSLKEACACNLPVVSVDVGDAREILEGVRNSYVVEGRDPEVIADKVIGILRTLERGNGAERARALAMEVVADRVIAVYRWVLEKAGRRRPR